MRSGELERLPAWALELLEGGRVARLGLLDDRDHPRVMPVTYSLAGGAVYSAVDDKPKRAPGRELARLRFLRRRPEAALTVDRYEDDWSRLAWVQLLGTVAVVEPDDHAEALDALTAKYEPYRAATPRGPLLRLAVDRALCWRAAG